MLAINSFHSLFMELPIFFAFLLFIFTVLWMWMKSNDGGSTPPPPLPPPPGPFTWPLIGNLHQLVGSLPHHTMRSLAKKYGSVMQLQIGEVPTVIISSPEAAKEVTKTNELNFVERPNLLVAKIMFYNRADVVFAPYGEYWRQIRKACILELFSAKRVRSFRSIRKEEVSNFCRTIYLNAGSPINLSKMFNDLSIAITARASIGKKFKRQEAFLPVIKEVMRAVGGVNVVDVFPSSKLLYMISRAKSRLERLHEEADEILEDIINERRANKEMKENIGMEDLLDVLLNMQNHGNLEHPLTTNNIKAIILDMFTGGSDTSATILEWTMSELLKNPRIMKKAQDEVRQVLGNHANVDETSLHNLKFLKLVIKESLRLHPPLPLIPKECNKTCKINGYVIQAKSKVMINAWAIGRDSDYWTSAEKFYPERFLDISVDYKGTNFEFIPFGAGKRMCPGLLFGIATIELSLAYILYHFDWKLSNGTALEDLDMNEAYGGTVSRKHHLNLIPIPYGVSPLHVE